MIPSDQDLVRAAAATYENGVPVFQGINNAIRIFMWPFNGMQIVAIEGTRNPAGWALDFLDIRADTQTGKNDEALGWVHAGFLEGALTAINTVAALTAGSPYAICGHSLGAAEALLLGALMIIRGKPPMKIGAFAPPRVGGVKFIEIISKVPYCAYRFGQDIVPMIPPALDPLFPYRQVNLTQIGETTHNVFDDHAIGNYVSAVPLPPPTPKG